ncbi:MAG TPA: DUF3991 and TOPRIM domain-containing protein, partial [Pyrinomonadaceae bacterium]|nr:DUF3991 and TOPRIM domain-containing protein [Pyrinomonadaceae bacterium]
MQSRNLPGELNGIVRKFLMADAPVIEPLNEVETKAYYEKVADAFSNVEIARENEEFVVYGKTLEGRGTEYGRFVFLPDLKAYDNNNDSNFEYKLISIVGKAYDSKNELFFSEEAEAVEQIKTLFGEHVSAEFQAAEGQWTVPEITTAESNLTEALSEVETVILNDQEMVSTTDVIADYQPPKLTYREVTEKLKEIPLEDVMPHLGLSLTYDRKRREYVYRDNGNSFKIAVKNDLFCDRYTGKGNRNAINLVREVLGVEFSEAKAFLLERLGIDYVPQETNDKAIVRNESQKEKRPFVMPERNDNKLHIVHDYLTVERGLDESIVNEQIEQGNIFANSFGSNTFVYRNEDGKILGAAWRAVVGTKRGDIAGTDKINAWFYLGDLKNASTVIVVEAPIEAMSYAQLHPDIDLKTTAIVSTSGSSVPASIVKILESNAGKDGRLVIAYNNDKGGHRGAENLLEKTGRFVLLDHKSHHLNNLIETTDFSGSILRDIPKLEDWNEDVKAARESEFQETDGEDTGDEIDSISRPVILPQADNVRLDSLEVVSMEGWHTSPDVQAREFPVSFDSITEFNRYIQTEKRAGASYKTDVKLTLNQGSELFQTFLVGEDLPDTLTGMLDRQIEMFERMKDLPQFTDQSEDVNAEIGSYKFIRNAVEQSYAEELKSFVSEDNPELFHADEEIRAGYTPEMIRATKINAPIHFKDYGQTEILLARENENEPFYTIGYRTRIGDDVIEKLPVPTDKKYAQGKQSLSNIYDELRRVLLACWQEKGEPRFTITETEINPDADKYLAFILNKTESYARDFSVRSFEKSFSVIPDFSEAEINVLRNWKTRTTNDAFFKIEDVFYKEIPNAKPYQNLMHKLINAGLVEVRQEGALTLVKGGNPLIAAAMSYLTENAVDSLKLTLGEARILELQFRKTEYAVLLGDRLSDDDR